MVLLLKRDGACETQNTSLKMPPLQFEDALSYLQKCQSTEGASVFDNLTNVLAKVQEAR